MPAVRQRILWSGAALSPALTVLVLPDRMIAAPLAHFGANALLLLSCCAAFVAAFVQTHAAPRPALMRRAALRRALLTGPDPDGLRATVAAVLAHAPLESPDIESRDQALARVFLRILASWGRPDATTLSPAELLQLCTLKTLIESGPAQAAALSDGFVHPAMVLDLRDTLARIASRWQQAQDLRPVLARAG